MAKKTKKKIEPEPAPVPSPTWNGEEVIAVIFHEDDEKWQPHSIFTRRKISGLDESDRWTVNEYDAAYSKASGTTYVHLSGGSGYENQVHLHAYAYPEDMPGRIWLHQDTILVDGGKSRDDGDRTILRSELASMGHLLLEDFPDDAFDDCVEGDANWCEICQDNINEEEAFWCVNCQCPSHEHGHGQAFVVFSDDEEVKAGIYRILTRVTQGFLQEDLAGYLEDKAIERIGPIPDYVNATPGWECDLLCNACRDRIVAELAKAGALDRPYSIEDLLKICRKMDAVVEKIYPMMTSCEVHPFVEFNGLMREYVVICRILARSGVAFPFASNHGTMAVEVPDYTIEYMAEKLGCIFAPMIRGNPRAKDILVRALTEAE